MWIVLATLHVFLMALVNYSDEYLTQNNSTPEAAGVHKQVGGLVIISTLMTFVGAGVLWLLLAGNIEMYGYPLYLAVGSAIPLVTWWIVYFYLLLKFPAYQVVPLFQLSSIWLLLIELTSGERLTLYGVMGVILLVLGSYFLDSGKFKWQSPTKLLLMMIPGTLMWSITLLMIKYATRVSSVNLVSFWQLITIAIIGVLLFAGVKVYREGFWFRIQSQGKTFLGLSLFNESVAMTSHLVAYAAVAIAPVAAYVSAMSGVQSVFLVLLLWLFPFSKARTGINRLQIISIFVIGIGVAFLELG